MKELIDEKSINIAIEDFLNYIKLSCKISTITEEVAKQKIIELSAKEAGINVEVSELQKAADNFRIDKQLYNTKDTWSWLEQHYLSLDDFEALVYANALTEKLAQYLFADQVDSWFYGHQLDYVAAVLYEVILEPEDLAMELFCSLQEREISFQEVARKYIQIQDLSLRRAGGYLGIVHRQDLQPEISAAVFEASPPQILKPIKTHKGNHLILVEEIIEPTLDDELRAQIISDLFATWLNEQIQTVQINANFLEVNQESMDTSTNSNPFIESAFK
ncbi:MAG: peptidylprolyl isomerase [Cyanobacteria bacterium P01_G01_bin.39]